MEKFMKRTLLTLFCLVFGMVTSAQAHSIWINNFFSDAHFPPHTMVSLGWGHALPMDDILNSPDGQVVLESFEIINPDMTRTALKMPTTEKSKAIKDNADYAVFPGDLAVQKIALKKDSKPGVYQIAAATKAAFYTQYIDKKGRERMALKPRDEIKDIDKVLMSVKFQAFAKSFMTVGKWSQPARLGHGLEITPLTDLSNLHVGDLVEFEVLFNGKPVTVSAKNISYITAMSPSFGQPDHFALFSYVKNGKAQFRVQSAGQWVVSMNHKGDVTKDGPLKALYGKANQVYHGASLTFTVK